MAEEAWHYYATKPGGPWFCAHEWGWVLGESATQACAHCPTRRCKPRAKAQGEAERDRRWAEAMRQGRVSDGAMRNVGNYIEE